MNNEFGKQNRINFFHLGAIKFSMERKVDLFSLFASFLFSRPEVGSQVSDGTCLIVRYIS